MTASCCARTGNEQMVVTAVDRMAGFGSARSCLSTLAASNPTCKFQTIAEGNQRASYEQAEQGIDNRGISKIRANMRDVFVSDKFCTAVILSFFLANHLGFKEVNYP